MKKPGIPTVPYREPDTYNLLSSLKETCEILTGVRGGKLSTLASNANTSDIINKINEIIARLNA